MICLSVLRETYRKSNLEVSVEYSIYDNNMDKTSVLLTPIYNLLDKFSFLLIIYPGYLPSQVQS